MNNVKGLLVGRLIGEKLLLDNVICEKVGDRIFPITITDLNSTAYPFIVHTRMNTNSTGSSKDGSYGDNINFNITIVSDDYDECLDLAEEVRNLFENNVLRNADLRIKNVLLISSSEDFSNNAFIQSLNFSCIGE